MRALLNLLRLPSRVARLQQQMDVAMHMLSQLAEPGRLARQDQQLAAMAARLADPAPRAAYLGGNTALVSFQGDILVFIDTRGTDIAPHLIMGSGWEPDEMEVFRRQIRAGHTVLDVGAHLGTYALVAAREVGAAGTVHAFEPNPNNAALLRRSITANGWTERVRLHEAAVAGTRGVATLLVQPEWSGGAHLDSARDQPLPAGWRRLEVRRVTLDELFPEDAQRVDVAKFDIEGMEGHALRGARGLLRRSRDIRLLLEWAPEMLAARGTPAPEVVAFLADLGFRFWSIEAGARLAHLPAETLAALPGGIRNILAARGEPA